MTRTENRTELRTENPNLELRAQKSEHELCA
jgi:hypothetical protein